MQNGEFKTLPVTSHHSDTMTRSQAGASQRRGPVAGGEHKASGEPAGKIDPRTDPRQRDFYPKHRSKCDASKREPRPAVDDDAPLTAEQRRIVEEHAHLVKPMVGYYLKKRGLWVGFNSRRDDFIAAGFVGLMKAVRRSSRDPLPKNFLRQAIHLQITADCRRLLNPSTVRESVVRRGKVLARLRSDLAQRLGHQPNAEEVQREFGWSNIEAERLGRIPDPDSREGTQPLGDVPARDAPPLSDSPEFREWLFQATRFLTAEERAVLKLRHLEGRSLADIAVELGVTLGEVRRIVTQAAARARRHADPAMVARFWEIKKEARGEPEIKKAAPNHRNG